MFDNYRYDFDGDNLISPDEVFILLSYIPFKNHTNAHQPAANDLSTPVKSQRQSSQDSLMRGSAEGMYNRSAPGHATNMNKQQRELE